MRRLPRLLCIVTLLMLVACPSKDNDRPRAVRSSSPPAAQEVCGRVVSTSDQTIEPSEVQAVFTLDKKLFLYDVESDAVVGLRGRSKSPGGFRPILRAPGSVTFADTRTAPAGVHFFGQDSIYEIRLHDRTVRELIRLPEFVHAYDWSPDARSLAYLIRSFTGDALTSMALCLYDSVAGTTRLIRSFGISDCSHAVPGAEQVVSWAPNASAVLIVDTCQGPSSLYVVRRDGHDRISPREGTQARWLGRRVVYRELGSSAQLGRWFILDIASGRASPLRIARGAIRPKISPDGRSVAFEDGDSDRPSTFLYDLAKGRTRLLARGYGAPIWLTQTVVAMTAGGPCPKNAECNGFWQPLDRTLSIDIRTGRTDRPALRTTLPENLYSSTIDSWVPVAG